MLDEKILNSLNNLRKDNSSGASEFIERALNIIKDQLKLINDTTEDIKEEIIELSKEIIDTRPSMAPLINTIGYLISDLNVINKSNIFTRIEEFYLDKIRRDNDLSTNFRNLIKENYKEGLTIMLISYSSTINKQLIKCKDFRLEIYALESRPLFEGRRTVQILSDYFKTHLIIDAAMGKFIDEIDLVLIGIDSVLKDGSIINKIGTFPLCVLASEKNIDVYAIGSSFKYNLKSHFGKDVIIEKKPEHEVMDIPKQVQFYDIHNYYFDITSPDYISGIISDLGIQSIPKFLSKIVDILPIDWYKEFLEG